MSSPITAPKRQPLAESSGIILGRDCKSEDCVLLQPKLLDSFRLAPRFSSWPFKSAWRSCQVPWIQSRLPAGSQYPLQPGQACCKACPWHAAASLARLLATPPRFMGGLARLLCLDAVCFRVWVSRRLPTSTLPPLGPWDPLLCRGPAQLVRGWAVTWGKSQTHS